jgi:hypothetical protein
MAQSGEEIIFSKGILFFNFCLLFMGHVLGIGNDYFFTVFHQPNAVYAQG